MAEPAEAADSSDAPGHRLYWLALLTGLAVGLIGACFHGLVDHLAGWRLAFVAGAFDGTSAGRTTADAFDRLTTALALPVPGMTAARFVILFLVIVAALASARWLVRRFAPEAAGSGIQEIEGFLLGLRPMRWRRVLAVKFAAGGIALGAGFVLGREGPTVQMGGAAALGIAQGARCDRDQTRALVAAGAGAGIAAAFNAPIAGALFVFEELRRASPYSFAGYHAVLIACVAATLVTQAVAGIGPELGLDMATPALAEYPLYAGLGIVLGAAGSLFNRFLIVALDLLAAWSHRAPWSMVATLSLGVTTLLFVAPTTTGGGEQIIPMLASLDPGFGILLLLLGIRTLATLASYGAGAPGGIFAPILALATLAGLTYAEAAGLLLPAIPLEPTAVAAAAMAALFTGSIRAPLVGVVLVAELTDAYPALLAITLSSAMASLAAAACGGRPLYEMLLERALRASR